MKERDFAAMSREDLEKEIDSLDDEIQGLTDDLAQAEMRADSLEEFSDETVEREYLARGLGFDQDDIRLMFEHFYLGRDSQAVEIAKRISQQGSGRYL